MKKIAIFVSGGGSNFRKIYNQIQKGDIPAKIVLVVSNNPQCGAIIFASEQGLENFIVNDTRFPNPDTRDKLLLQALLKAEVELICLAGYMKLLPKRIVKEYKDRILNMHLVDEAYDHGKIIAQKKVKVRSGDTAKTLAKRVLKVEHDLYPKVVKAFCKDRVVWE